MHIWLWTRAAIWRDNAILYKYTIDFFQRRLLNTLFMNCLNVAGAYVKPKGMTLNWWIFFWYYISRFRSENCCTNCSKYANSLSRLPPGRIFYRFWEKNIPKFRKKWQISKCSDMDKLFCNIIYLSRGIQICRQKWNWMVTWPANALIR